MFFHNIHNITVMRKPNRLKLLLSVILLFCALILEGADHMSDFRRAMMLYDNGDYVSAKEEFASIARSGERHAQAAAYSVLCSIRLRSRSADAEYVSFISEYPDSPYRAVMSYFLACNDFDSGLYAKALENLQTISPKELPRSERAGYDFRLGYSLFMEGYYSKASLALGTIASSSAFGRYSDFHAPANYAMGYMAYLDRNLDKAEAYFEKSADDADFCSLSRYFITECRYFKGDFEYVASLEDASELMESLSGDYSKNLARMISESYLATGKDDRAREFYKEYFHSSERFTTEDYYYAGMVAYGVKSYADAIRNFSKVASGRDSLAQCALYYQGSSYINLGDKLNALQSFKASAEMDFDRSLKEDALFNYAKLEFDINENISGFESYVRAFPDTEKSDEIYGYQASAYMLKTDYASAVESFRRISRLDGPARDNFRKALFLRSMQLMSNGSFSQSVPLLKQIRRLKDGDALAFLSDYWLAEAYFRMDDFSQASALLASLVPMSQWSALPEYDLLQYNLGYALFKQGDYSKAREAFRKYLSSSRGQFRREAQLRNADCSFMLQDYEAASSQYESCADRYYDRGDIYPLYQSAVSYGLLGMEPKKIALLERARGFSPSVRYYDEALYELGRSYVNLDDDVRAEEIFRTLRQTSSDTLIVRGATLELASIFRNRTDYDAALEYYKEVVAADALSQYAQDALAAIESIYQAMNRPAEYLEYIESIGQSSIKTEDEKQMMIFAGAEQTFLKRDYNAALRELEAYLSKYPQGSCRAQAFYYIGGAYRNLGRYEKALEAYYQAMLCAEGEFAREATSDYAEISFRLERYQQAYEGYATLVEMASNEAERLAGLIGVMRSKYRLKEYRNAISSAESVAASPACDENTLREASYVRAKSYISLSERDKAAEFLQALAQYPDTDEGAEASYILIQELYDSGRFEEVEQKVYEFSEKAPSQTYFMAKAFIVLGDSFAERDKWEQAKATFNSILENYQPPKDGDDILGQVRMRLEQIAEMGV